MRQNPQYLLREIAGCSYLLPYGQMIADHKRGLRLNETGVYIWNLLSTEHSLEEILTLTAAHYEIAPGNYDAFRSDISGFLSQLCSHGILINPPLPYNLQPTMRHLLIGGVPMSFIGPEESFPEEFRPFLCDYTKHVCQTIRLHPGLPMVRTNGQVLLRNRELVVMELETFYILLFPTFPQISEIHITKDGAQVTVYHHLPYNEKFRTDLFHALRFTYLYLALQRGQVALHSASFLYRDKLWLFSGPSGTGKSTHTNLWKELYDITLINGDLNLIDTSKNQVMVPGIPWCGTSGINHTECYPLGGIILLKQAPKDYIEELTADRKELLVSQRLISPSWTALQFDLQLQAVHKIAQNAAICMLHCTKEPSAATCMKAWIDAQTDMQ